MPKSRKFLPLLALLEALPAKQHEVRFTFSELETLLSAPLPPSAMRTGYWSDGNVGRYNWHFVGFRARLGRLPPAVTFTRRTQHPR